MKKQRYYRLIQKGDLTYFDLLKVNESERTITYLNECTGDSFSKKDYKFCRFKKFEKHLDEYSEKKYRYLSLDGAKDRLSSSDSLDALNLKFPLEKLIECSRIRPAKGDYYRLDYVKNMLKAYQEDKINKFYLRNWVTLFSFCLEESFSKEKHKLDTFSYLVYKELYKFIIVIKGNLTEDEKEKAIKHVLFQIDLIDAKRTKYLLKQQVKLHKKAVVEQ